MEVCQRNTKTPNGERRTDSVVTKNSKQEISDEVKGMNE